MVNASSVTDFDEAIFLSSVSIEWLISIKWIGIFQGRFYLPWHFRCLLLSEFYNTRKSNFLTAHMVARNWLRWFYFIILLQSLKFYYAKFRNRKKIFTGVLNDLQISSVYRKMKMYLNLRWGFMLTHIKISIANATAKLICREL